MPTIVHFEIPTDNVEKSRKFYSELFDWNVEKWTGTEYAGGNGILDGNHYR
jgi:predicted enzyme related to lactoylglutathione lyase